MKVLIDKNNVVVAKALEIKEVENGFLIAEQNAIYAPHDLQLVETKLNPRVQQDKLINGKILANENYKTPEQIEAELVKLREGR
jgi:hypothetical protein